MEALDQLDAYLESLAHGAPLWMTLVIALLLGLRHATDPDHLAAVSTLVAKDGADERAALRVGTAWGFGHGVTMLLFGLPVVLFAAQFPEGMYKVAEAFVGLLIMYFALRLLGQSIAGRFHFHGTRRPHSHGDIVTSAATSRKSFGIGMVHGIGGSYGGALLVLATFHTPLLAAGGLALFVTASVASMAAVTYLFVRMVTDHRTMHVVSRAMPVFATVAFVFGLFYLHSALS